MSDPYADLLKANGVDAPAEDDPYAALLTQAQAKPKAEPPPPVVVPTRGLNALEQAFFANPANTSLHQRTPEQMANLYGSNDSISASPQPEGNITNAVRGMAVNTGVGLDKSRLNAQAWMGDLLDLTRKPTAEGEVLQKDRLRKYDAAQGRADAAKPAYNLGFTNDLYDATTSLAQTAPSLALAVATKNPALGLGLAGMQSADYLKYKQRGATVGEASLGAAGEGAVEILTEKSPMGFMIGKYGSKSAKEFISGYLIREGLGEQAATLAQDAIDTAIANPDKTWGDYLKERPNAAYQTALATLVTGGAVSAPKAISEVMAGKPKESGPTIDDYRALVQSTFAGKPATPPQPQPAPSTPSNTKPAIDALDAIIARSQQKAPTEAAPADPYRALVETASPQYSATVETAQPVNLAEAFRATVETPPPRAIAETPGPQGIVETAAPVAETPAIDAPLAEPQPAPPADLPPTDLISQPGEMVAPVADATDPELTELTKALIVQIRDAKQLDLDRSLRTAIDRIKSGGMAEKPAYFTKLAKEFEKRGDVKTAGMLGQVADTLKAKQKAIPKPPKPKVSALATKDPGEYGEAARRVFLQTIKKAGGVSIENAADITGETRVNASRMSPGFFATGAPGIDLVARRLHEAGYITDAEYNAADGGVQVARDLINDALRKQPVLTSEQQERMAELEAMEADAHAELQSESEQADLDAILGLDMTEDEFTALHSDLPADEAADQISADGAAQQENEDVYRKFAESQAATGEAQPGSAEANPQSGEGQPGRAEVSGTDQAEARPDLSLTQQTERDLAERERELNRREAEQNARERAALDKENADRARDDFSLTGSDRASDANAGQGDLLSQQEPAKTSSASTGAASVSPAETPDDQPKQKIDDAGQKIGGARKDRWKERGLNIADLDDMSESEGAELATKANVWKPDYEAISERSGNFAAAMVKVIYDRLAAQPKDDTPAGRRRYVAMMQHVRSIYDSLGPGADEAAFRDARINLLYDNLKWTEGRGGSDERARQNAIGVPDLGDHMKEARATLFSVYKGRSEPFAIDFNDRSKANKMVADGFPAKGEPWKKRLVVRLFGGPGMTPRGVEITLEQAQGLGTPLTEEQLKAGAYRVTDKNSKVLAYLPTEQDAEAAAKAIYERDMKGGNDGKPEPARPHLDRLNRENLPKRLDRDAKAEDFINDLGFRGIEFGNWSAQDERQRILNMAYDGLMDLAEILGIPPKAMSLNGTLGMAFGARGSGRALAHYEPGKLVINMTKINGGGSMAHEWAHALDHYFGELNQDDAYTKKARGASGWYDEDQYSGVLRKRMEMIDGKWKAVEKRRLENLRPEMAEAFDGVMRALFMGHETKAEHIRGLELQLERTRALEAKTDDADLKDMYRRTAESQQQNLDESRKDPDDQIYPKGRSQYANEAQKLSGKSERGYWLRPTEMFARSFESWVFDRVTAMGAKSDYLVHGVEADRFAGGNYKGNPYPAGTERATINAAFEKLAATLETKETDSGIAMFSRGNPEAAGNAGAVTQVELDAVIKRVASGWKRAQGDGGRLIAVETAADLPAAILRAADAQNVPQNEIKGVFHNGHIYLVRDNHTDARAVEETIFHEAYGHYGARLLNGNDAQKLSAAFSDLWKRIGALDGVRKMADKFGVLNQVEPYIKSLATADMPLDTKRRIIVDELLAHVAGRGEFTLKEQAKAYLGALRVGLRNAARRMKLDGIAQALDGYTDAELLLNLKQMREAVVSGAGGKGKGTLFHRVFHGTPHVWEAEPGFPHGRPRLDKMGSGEGAQAYGWGWYSAEAQNVAGGYADALRNPVELDGKKPDTMRMGFANTAIINYFQNRLAAKIGDDRARQQTAAWAKHNGQINGDMADAEIDAFIARLSEGKGNLYQLDIPEASLPYLLDWDAVWEDQPQQVRDALQNTAAWEYMEERVDSRASRRGENFIGRDIYNDLLEEYSPQEASEYLASIGIVGTKYLDGNSRNKGEGSSNYVLWDQPTLDKVALLERNGETLDAMREQPMFARTATLTGQPQATQQPSDWRDPLGRVQFAPAVRLKDAANRGIANLVAKSETAQAVYDAFKIAPPKLQVAIRKMKATQQQALDQAGEVAKATKTMTPAEKALVSDIIEGMVKPGVIPPEHIVAVADRIRSIMDVQTDELVKLGMLAKDTADRWRGKYLPRFYNRQKDPALDTWGKKLLKTAMPIRGLGGNSLKARGLFQTVNVAEVGKWEALGWEVRDPLWQNKSGTLELKQADKLLNDPDSVQMWRDFNPAERENMGEIRDAVFRFAMGYTSMQNDIALGRMFDAIARNQEWTRPRAEDGYVHVPETEIADTGGVKRYGNLAGLYVRKDIMSHLSQHDEGGEVLKLYRRAMGVWKMGKVPMNPVSHANNTVSNLTMAHLAGVSYWDGHKYAAAMRDFVKGAPMLDEAKEVGLLTGDITRAEILSEMPQEIRDMLNMQESQLKKKGRAVYDLMTYFLRKPMLTAYRFEDDFFKYLIYRDARTQGLKPEDAMLYATQYIFNYDDLPKGARAVRDTAIPFFSYTYKAFPALIHAATHYPWRFLAPSAVVGGYSLAVYGAMAALMGGDDDEWDKALAQKEAEQKNLAPWDQGKSLFLTDKTFRTGATDDRTGLPVFINIYRMLPGGDMLDTGHGESTTLPAPLMPSHPILGILAAMIPQINKDVFTGKELVDKNDTAAEVAKKRLNYLTDALAPAIAPTGYHADRLLNTLADSLDTTISLPFIDVDYTGIGKDGLPIQAKYAIPQTFGVKMRPVDLERNAEFDAIDDRAKMLSIKREVRSAKMQMQRGSMTARQYQSVLADAKEKINRMRDE